MIIHLNGMPGVGKLTVAKILAKKLPARLIDNHSLIDAALTCGEHGSPAMRRALYKIAKIVYEELRKKPKSENFIFTNALANEFPSDPERFKAVQKLAQQRNTSFFPILLTCSLKENKRRLQLPSRKHKRKLTDPKVLSSFYKTYTFINPVNNPLALSIDVTKLAASEVAEQIKQHVMQKSGL